VVERFYHKIREMYSDYKSKGLIPNDFPEITLMQMKDRIENFIKNVLDSFVKQNLDPLTNLDTYSNQLFDYQKEVFYTLKTSWFNEFMDTENCYIKKKTGQKIYTFKKNLDDQKKNDAISKLKGIIDNVVVDHDAKVIYINDIKTTSKDLKDFPESIEFYNYWLQAAIYCTIIAIKFINLIDRGYQLKFHFVVIDKAYQVYAFPVSDNTLNSWFNRLTEALDKADWHYTNRSYDLPYDFAIGKVIL
jgi:hypothetical protein